MNDLEEQNYRKGFTRGAKGTEQPKAPFNSAAYLLGFSHGKRGRDKQTFKALITGKKEFIYFPNNKEIRHTLKQHNL